MTLVHPANGPDRWHHAPGEPDDLDTGIPVPPVPARERRTPRHADEPGPETTGLEDIAGVGEIEFKHVSLTGDDRHMVAVFGEIDLATAPQLRTELLTALVRRSPRLVLDLSGVTFLDSTALGVLVAVHRRARAAGGELSIAGPRPLVRKLLGITYLDRVLPFYEGRGAAGSA